MFASRQPRSDAHLSWRVRLFAGAAVLALIGMFADQRLPIWGAITLLLIAIGLRFLPGPTDDGPEAAEADDTGTLQ